MRKKCENVKVENVREKISDKKLTNFVSSLMLERKYLISS